MSEKAAILIIEDQRGFRTIYGDLLADAGYEVLSAEDGEKGWQMSKEKKPDLILLDLGLPKMDGFEVLRHIRGDAQTKKIPIIICSVVEGEKSVQKAMELGANDYTVKGLHAPRQILDKIKSYLP